MSKKSKKKEISNKRAMLIFWAVASLLWLGFSAYMFHMNQVSDVWKLYNHYENMIQNGSGSDYTRRAYMRATDRLNDMSRDVGLFFLVGLGMPGLMLSLGTWLMRKSK